MSNKSKARPVRKTAKEKKAAVQAANRKATLQWYAIGASAVAAVVIAIVLLSVFTEGELPIYGHG